MGSVYKVDVIIVGGIPIRALIYLGSQVRELLLLYIKEKQNWSESNCLVQYLTFDSQPIEAESSLLGAKTLV